MWGRHDLAFQRSSTTERARGFEMVARTKQLGVRSRPGTRAVRLRAALVLGLLGSVAWSVPARAQCGGTQLCAAGLGDCTVAANCTITVPAAGLTADLGARKLAITKTLTVSGPGVSNLTITAGSRLLGGAAGDTIAFPGDVNTAGQEKINVNGDATMKNNGLIDVSAGVAPGSVDVEALGGNMSFSGRIKANAMTRAGDGGDITLYGLGNLTASGMLDASAG